MTRFRTVTALGAAVLVAALAACSPSGDESVSVTPSAPAVYPNVVTFPEITVLADLEYTAADGTPMRLDVCLPTEEEPAAASDDIPLHDGDAAEPGLRAAIVSIHGGSWQRGDKANLTWRSICQWFASEGFVGVSVSYRLSPAAVFPAALEDVQAAVRWLREDAQRDRFRIDPTRIGAFGGSAGGNLAALLGTTGSGDWTGSRVAAVAELSGPVDLREPIEATDTYRMDFPTVQLEYLGCTAFAGCATAAAASPVTLVDASDPPFFIAHSTRDFIPIAQSDELVELLRDAGVDTTYVTVEGDLHSAAMLDDDMRQRVLDFFRRTLPESPFDLAVAAAE